MQSTFTILMYCALFRLCCQMLLTIIIMCVVYAKKNHRQAVNNPVSGSS